MAKSWFYAKDSQQLGPAAEEAVRQMLQSGELPPTTLVWCEGMPQWMPASSVAEFMGAAPVGPPVTPVTAMPLGYQGYAGASGPMPKTWLTESILCLCCCWPFAIVAIVYAAQVKSKYNMGDAMGAEMSSQNARKWVMLSFWIGLVIYILRFALVGLNGLNHR